MVRVNIIFNIIYLFFPEMQYGATCKNWYYAYPLCRSDVALWNLLMSMRTHVSFSFFILPTDNRIIIAVIIIMAVLFVLILISALISCKNRKLPLHQNKINIT
jgi:hypothetical protein